MKILYGYVFCIYWSGSSCITLSLDSVVNYQHIDMYSLCVCGFGVIKYIYIYIYIYFLFFFFFFLLFSPRFVFNNTKTCFIIVVRYVVAMLNKIFLSGSNSRKFQTFCAKSNADSNVYFTWIRILNDYRCIIIFLIVNVLGLLSFCVFVPRRYI